MKITFKQSTDIKDYRPIIDTLIPDFDYVFLHTILQWCKLASSKEENKFWEVFLIRNTVSGAPYRVRSFSEVIGICGLYSLRENSTESLWLGWFGIIPELRNKGIGKEAMKFLYEVAQKNNCKEILSYVDKDGKPLSFYKREGFEVIGTVKEYMEANNMLHIDGNDFEDENDFVIKKLL